jgi:malto-oligosyltrehalose trehalohydrolase
MPFGAQIRQDGAVRFALWAPAVRRVELCLEQEDNEMLLPMVPQGDGWFHLVTDQAKAGSRYRYRIDSGLRVPDPASRFQPRDIHGPSQVVDSGHFEWGDADWRGRPWEETVIYELHVGAFSETGDYRSIIGHLDHLVELGVTAIELMPLADFPGARDWGYDGALLFAPDSCYGTPDELKALIEAAHEKGLMVFLDVVYNHFGPEGNYLHAYAPQFFTERHHTPWGAAINFDGPDSTTVRRFFIHNALYWLEEFHLDGLRLDAVHAILDDSSPDILEELALAVQQGPGRNRYLHLVLENDHNAAHYLSRDEQGRPRHYVAQWNDDIHHCLHVLLTGERDGYYMDYGEDPILQLGRCLAEGFAYQGERSRFRQGAARGEPSGSLPSTAFISFMQNHDQVGNRAFGERLSTLIAPAPLRAALSILLLAPSPPLLFMGEEFATPVPFLFFCDFGADLIEAVSEGRRREFARFSWFADPQLRQSIPDPNAPDTFQRSILAWKNLAEPRHREWFGFYRRLLRLRREWIIPRLGGMRGGGAFQPLGQSGLRLRWTLGDGSCLSLLANLGDRPLPVGHALEPVGNLLYQHPPEPQSQSLNQPMPPWSVIWLLVEASP